MNVLSLEAANSDDGRGRALILSESAAGRCSVVAGVGQIDARIVEAMPEAAKRRFSSV